MVLYKKILTQSWKISWRHKYLWFFGLFAAFLGAGGEYEILSRTFSPGANQSVFPGLQKLLATGIFSKEVFSNIGQIIKEDPIPLITALIVLLVVFVLFLFLIWLAVVSQAALVNNVSGYLDGKKGDLKSGILDSSKKFWPVFSLNIIIKFIVYITVGLMSLPIISAVVGSSIFANLFYVISFIILVFIFLSLSFIVKYSIAYIVIKNNTLLESIKNGWQLFKNNWLVSAEMAVILFLINLVAGLLIILAVLALMIPFLFLALAVYKLASLAGFWLIMTFGFIILLAIIVIGGAILSVFQIASWTNLFIELVDKGATSKIIRVVEKISKKL